MASSACQFEVGEIINIKQARGWIPAIILDIQAPLGFKMFQVLEIDTGKVHTVTRLEIEKTTTLNSSFLAEDFDLQGNPTTPPQPKTSRFEKMEDSEVDELQMFSKSDKTHVNTRWGVKIFRGL